MKTMLALLCSIMTTIPGHSQSAPPNAAADGDSAAPVIDGGRYKPNALAAAAKAGTDKDASKKTEPAEKEYKIEGVEVPRGARGFLGVQIVSGAFKISFYDSKKKPIPADVNRALLRWDPKYKVGQERLVLTASEDGKSLTSPKPIRPPYLFKLFITLTKDASETAEPVGETYVIDFRA